MAAYNKGIFLRAQRHIAGDKNEEKDQEPTTYDDSTNASKERLLLKDLASRYDTKFGVRSKKSDLDETNGDVRTEDSFAQANIKLNPGLTNSALDKFRRAGMKARLVQRVNRIVEERLTAKQIFSRFTKESTLHGFRFIFTKTFYIRRFIWFIITVVMAAMFLKELTDSVRLFFQHPFSTTSTVEYVDRLTFPAISICNLNDFRFSKINNTKLADVFSNNKKKTQFDLKSSQDIDGERLSTQLRGASHRIEDMFIRCIWEFSNTAAHRAAPCTSKNLTAFYHTNEQTCYTFNSGQQGHRLLTLNETGLFHGFEIQLDLETHEYMNDIQEGGIRVFVHDQEETPFSSAGFAVSPGFKTFVSLGVQKIENLPPPYATQCGSRNLDNFATYKKSKCYLEELTKFAVGKCKCRGMFMPDHSYPLCSLKQMMDCLQPTIKTFDQRARGACPEDCLSTQYSTQLSYARYVSRPPIGSSRITIPSRIRKMNLTDKQLEEQIRDNIVYLIFFFPELRVENVKQTPTYDFYKLVGDVGGQLGLMLGASVLTLVEFIDLLAFITYHQILRLTRLKKKKKRESLQLKMKEANGNGAREGAFADF